MGWNVHPTDGLGVIIGESTCDPEGYPVTTQIEDLAKLRNATGIFWFGMQCSDDTWKLFKAKCTKGKIDWLDASPIVTPEDE
jgi:hypothetical protein